LNRSKKDSRKGEKGAALATVVGVLVEVPVMLSLVRIARATRSRFPSAEGPAA